MPNKLHFSSLMNDTFDGIFIHHFVVVCFDWSDKVFNYIVTRIVWRVCDRSPCTKFAQQIASLSFISRPFCLFLLFSLKFGCEVCSSSDRNLSELNKLFFHFNFCFQFIIISGSVNYVLKDKGNLQFGQTTWVRGTANRFDPNHVSTFNFIRFWCVWCQIVDFCRLFLGSKD